MDNFGERRGRKMNKSEGPLEDRLANGAHHRYLSNNEASASLHVYLGATCCGSPVINVPFSRP